MNEVVIGEIVRQISRGRKVANIVASDPNTHALITNSVNDKGQAYLNRDELNNKNITNKQLAPRVMHSIINKNIPSKNNINKATTHSTQVPNGQ